MTSPAFDSSELRTFATDLGRASFDTAAAVRASVSKGALNIKNAMRSDMQASRHFKGISRAIDYDMTTNADSITADIGPRHGDGEAGNLANIAYFGTSRGGGTVRDPQAALDEEIPAFEKALADLLGDVL